jgi:uncharacterized protein
MHSFLIKENHMSMLKKLGKFALWLGAAAAVLVLGIALYSYYIIASFDTLNLPANYAQVEQKLFLAPGSNRPLLVGLGGAEGGNGWAAERWAGQRQRFNDAGFAMLALGYFGAPNTPEKLDRIALEGVIAAIEQAQQSPQVSDQCVVLIGGSKGAELALLLASHYPQINAVIAVVPPSAAFPAHTDAMVTSSWAHHGQQIEFLPMPWSATWDLISGDLHGVMRRMLANKEQLTRASIPVERIRGPVLLISATEDEMWPSTQMSELMMARLKSAQFPFPYQHLAVPGGHGVPFKDFDAVEDFLREQVRSLSMCSG